MEIKNVEQLITDKRHACMYGAIWQVNVRDGSVVKINHKHLIIQEVTTGQAPKIKW